MKSISDILKTLASRTKKIIWVLGLYAFSLIISLILIDFVFGCFMFYEYVFLAGKETPAPTGNIVKFNVKAYQDVLGELQVREQDDTTSSTTN